MVQEIDEAYWGRYTGTKGQAKVYARKVYLTVTAPQGLPTLPLKVIGFDEASGRAVLEAGNPPQPFTLDFSTMGTLNQGGEPVKMMVSGQHKMFMEEKYKDGEPPSLVIPIILVVGVILLLVIVFDK